MAKAVAKSKKIAAKSKPSVPARAKAAPPATARKALKKSPAKPAPKAASKSAASKPASDAVKSGKWVFTFGDGKAEGKAGLRDLLGGKGANLAEMANLGLPVPPGFTIPTSVCTYFYAHDKSYPKELKTQVEKALDHVGKLAGKAFGDAKNPLLVSVRSGGRASMPGMMDTVLNLGLNTSRTFWIPSRTARAIRSTPISPATTGSIWSGATRMRWRAKPARISRRIRMRNYGARSVRCFHPG
jgi:pyruvate,orthophosphate dikinase